MRTVLGKKNQPRTIFLKFVSELTTGTEQPIVVSAVFYCFQQQQCPHNGKLTTAHLKSLYAIP